MLEGRALGEATYDLLLTLSSNIDSQKLPQSKFTKMGSCGSDKDCKGDRICVEGKCLSPNLEKKLQGGSNDPMEQK